VVVGRSRVGAGPLPADAPTDPFEAARALPRDPVYDLDLPCARASRHQVDRLLDLVRWCGAEPAAATPALVLREPDRVEARRALAEALAHVAPGTGEAPARIVGFHPGAANELKCWPLQSFVELGVALARGSEREGPAPALVVFDSPRERGRAAALCAGLEARGVWAAFLPAAGIEWFAALCSHLDLLVGNDSGVMHIAAALAVPTVSFHSLGDPREWGPRGARAVAFHAPKGIAAIPVAAAVEAVRALLRS
jgi:ADP-heptose:LPS heptosyltransferase